LLFFRSEIGFLRQRLEAKLLEAVERGDYREVTPEFWNRLEAIARGKSNPPR
jgi:hypothetical protein